MSSPLLNSSSVPSSGLNVIATATCPAFRGTGACGSSLTLTIFALAPSGENTCRILSNARCLSEGVDVPSEFSRPEVLAILRPDLQFLLVD